MARIKPRHMVLPDGTETTVMVDVTGRGRGKQTSRRGVLKKMNLWGTPRTCQVLAYVCERELKEGRKGGPSFVFRALVELGAKKYAELGELPQNEL
jgi:hypothetical protein